MAQRDFKTIVLTGKMNDRGFFRHILKKMKLFLSVDNNGTLLTDKSCRSHTVSDLRIRFFFMQCAVSVSGGLQSPQILESRVTLPFYPPHWTTRWMSLQVFFQSKISWTKERKKVFRRHFCNFLITLYLTYSFAVAHLSSSNFVEINLSFWIFNLICVRNRPKILNCFHIHPIWNSLIESIKSVSKRSSLAKVTLKI